MRHLLNLPIKLKLALGFGVVVVFLVLVAGIAIVAMTELRDAQIEIQEIHLANVIDYQALDANLSKNRVLLNRMMRSRDHSRQDELQRSLATASEENDAIMARLAARVVRDPLPQDKFAALQHARDAFNKIRDEQIIPAILNGRMADAEAAFDASAEGYREVSALASDLAGLAREHARHSVEESIILVREAMLWLGIIALAAVLFSAFCIAALFGAIAVPVRRVAEEAARISEGELDISTPWEDRQDEVGAMARAFNRMTASLRGLAGIADHIAEGDLTDRIEPRSKRDRLAISFGIMSENLRGLVGEMQAGAGEVNAATAEILDVTREFVVDMPDRKRARAFQNSLLRLEEVGKRLDVAVSSVRLK